jgi:hypothetical protein
MEDGDAIILMRLSVREQPIELGQFVAAFTSLAAEFERYKKDTVPDFAGNSSLYVKEVRKGSIEAILVSALQQSIPSALAIMENANTVMEFVNYYAGRLKIVAEPGARLPGSSKSELVHFTEQVAAIADIENSQLELAAYTKTNGEISESAVFKFNTQEARKIQENTAAQIGEIENREFGFHSRVAMVFERTDTHSANPGKKSGDMVRIEALSDKRLNLIYSSDLTESEIKKEIRDSDENVYKKVFIVDVYIETINDRPIAYRVANLHDVFVPE